MILSPWQPCWDLAGQPPVPMGIFSIPVTILLGIDIGHKLPAPLLEPKDSFSADSRFPVKPVVGSDGHDFIQGWLQPGFHFHGTSSFIREEDGVPVIAASIFR